MLFRSPGDKPKYELWMAGGQLASVDNVILTHYVDMENGQSGAPIFFSVVNKIEVLMLQVEMVLRLILVEK